MERSELELSGRESQEHLTFALEHIELDGQWEGKKGVEQFLGFWLVQLDEIENTCRRLGGVGRTENSA